MGMSMSPQKCESPAPFVTNEKQTKDSPATKSQPEAPILTSTDEIKDLSETKFISVLPAFAFLFISYNAFDALRKSIGKDDHEIIGFVIVSYVNLLLLFWCLRVYEKILESTSPKKYKLKVAIWTLATALDVSFSHRVTTIISNSIVTSVFVWTVAVVATISTFYALFLIPDTPREAANPVATDKV